MTTFIELQDTVASETRFVSRAADLSGDEAAQIRLHINEAIKAHQKDRFWFNEQLWERQTIIGQEFYALPAEYVAATTLSLVDPKRVLAPRSNEDLEGLTVQSAAPRYYALFADQYRLHPIPDAVYKLRLWGVRSFPRLTADGDTNPWLDNAFELVREASKARFFYSAIHDPEKAMAAQQAAMAARADLLLETKRRQPSTKIRRCL